MIHDSTVVINRAGIMTTIQGLANHGQRHLGVAVGGALDRYSLILANRLLGNSDDANGLELTAGRVSIQVNRDSWFVVTGSTYQITVNDRNIWPNWINRVKAGECINLTGPIPTKNSSMRAYIAFDGGIKSPATSLPLTDGVKLNLGRPKEISKPIGAVPRSYSNEVRALTGPEMSLFSAESRKLFWQQEWQVTTASNRMGCRLSGKKLILDRSIELNSHAVMPGVVQVPPSGQPIVLLADAQTTGGYPKIAVVIEADLWKLAQTQPNQSIKFVHVTPKQAEDAAYEWQQYFNRLRDIR